MNQPLAKLNFWREVAPIIWNRCFPTFHLKAAVTLKPVEGTMYKRLFKIGGHRWGDPRLLLLLATVYDSYSERVS